ncbi:glycosyltransferase family 32 protein [Terrisporobacter sp.]
MNNINRIPKKIHYCWIGGNDKPLSVENSINSWKKYLPDYEIIEWNENNFDFSQSNRYVKEAIKEKKWAFVSDYMRLNILYNEGGIYLDTDVEIVANLDGFLENDSFMCMESLDTVCTALIGSKKNQKWICELLELYDKRKFIKDDGTLDLTPNSRYIFEYLSTEYNLVRNNSINKLACRLTMYPSEYFSPKNYSTMKMKITENTHAIHHYEGMWKKKSDKIKDYALGMVTRIIGEENRAIIKNFCKKI